MASFKEIINRDTPVLVDFYADWCAPCKQMEPVIKRVSGKMRDQIHTIKVNVDKNPQAAHKYQIRSIPTFIIFQKGKVKWRHSGMINDAGLTKAINKLTAQPN